MSIPVRCRYDFNGTVYNLNESLPRVINDKDRQDKVWELEQIVTYCLQPKPECTFQVEEDPNDPIWNHLSRSEPVWDCESTESLLSLLDICYKLRASEQGLRLCYRFVHAINWLDSSIMIHFSNFISITEWSECRELLDVILFSMEPDTQILFSIRLINELLLCNVSQARVCASKLFELLSSQLFSSVPDCSTFDRIVGPIELRYKITLLSSIFLLQLDGLLKDVALFSFTANHLNNLPVPDLNYFVKLVCDSTLFYNFKFRCLELRLQHLLSDLCHRFLDVNVERSSYLLKWFELFDFVREPVLLQYLAEKIRDSDSIENRLLNTLAEDDKFMKKSKFASIRDLLFRCFQRPGVLTRRSSRR
jgi:hypothetical protein